MPSRLSQTRFWGLNLVLGALLCLIVYQLAQLTVLRRESLLTLANRQHQITIEIPALRGQILDRRGREFATNLKIPSVYAVPRLLFADQREKLVTSVSQILGLDKKFVLERFSRDKSFVWLKRRVSEAEARKIRELKSDALGITEEYKRLYPQGDLLSQILGFTDVDSQGLEGIELAFNHDLRGRAGQKQTKRDALGREIKAFEYRLIPAIDGRRVVLTIDQHLQYLTERALERAFTQWKAKGAMAVLMDPTTGEILAMANRPHFNPNSYESSFPDSRRNRSVTDMVEPGSVFKIIIASAALNENKVKPETIFDCENGEYRYGSHVLHDVHAYGNLTFADVIIKSSNIGTVKIAATLKPEVFQSYIDAFGFGKSTGIEIPGEVSGFTRPPSEWSATSPYNIPIGQEVLVTALQMVRAMAVAANGGNLVKPYIVDRVEDQAGVTIRSHKPQIVRAGVIRPEVASVMRGILQRVVDEGTGKKAQIKGIPVGGKTGTAQKILEGGRGYSHSNFISSFVGFAPVEEPKLVLVVVIDDPRPLYYGGTIAAPVFKEVMEPALLSMGHVPQDAASLSEMKTQLAGARANESKLQAAAALGTRS